MKTALFILFAAAAAVAGLRDQLTTDAGPYIASDDTRAAAYLREAVASTNSEIVTTNAIPADPDAIDRHAAALDVYGVMLKYSLPLTNTVNANIDLLQGLAAAETNEAKRLDMVMDGSRAGIKYMGLVQSGGLQASLDNTGQSRTIITTNTVTTPVKWRWQLYGLTNEPTASDLNK